MLLIKISIETPAKNKENKRPPVELLTGREH